MIGKLPVCLCIGGKNRKIRTDYRDCLTILAACGAPDLTQAEKITVMLDILYEDGINSIEDENAEEAIKQAVWFLNCGQVYEQPHRKPVYDWEQDEQIIFAAVNKVAGKELRAEEYIHFWTFISYFHEIGEGLFSTVVNIRSKLNRKKKLEQYEKDFYRDNKGLVDLKKKYTEEQQIEIDRLNKILG